MLLCLRPPVILQISRNCERPPHCMNSSNKDCLDIDLIVQIHSLQLKLKFCVHWAATICQALNSVDVGNDKFESGVVLTIEKPVSPRTLLHCCGLPAALIERWEAVALPLLFHDNRRMWASLHRHTVRRAHAHLDYSLFILSFF